MGVQYGLFDHTHRRWFDLGKGHWDGLLASVAYGHVEERLWWATQHWQFDKSAHVDQARAAYCIWLAERIDMVTKDSKELEIISDGTDRYFELTCGVDWTKHVNDEETGPDAYEKVGQRYTDADLPRPDQEFVDALLAFRPAVYDIP